MGASRGRTDVLRLCSGRPDPTSLRGPGVAEDRVLRLSSLRDVADEGTNSSTSTTPWTAVSSARQMNGIITQRRCGEQTRGSGAGCPPWSGR